MPHLKLAIVVPAYNEVSIQDTLKALYNQDPIKQEVHHFVVNNGSTDNTSDLIREFARKHKDFPLTLLNEPKKGTGVASDTGFRMAIKQGYSIIARTDADTQPLPGWTQKIISHFDSEHPPCLLGGQSLALVDEDYRLIDSWLTPASSTASRWIFAMMQQKLSYRKLARGCNMATRADVYTAVGGFPRGSMHELDEDVEYSLKVIDKFGGKSVRIDKTILVRTSTRRFRRLGPIGTALYYLFPAKRLHHKIDVR